MLLRRRVRAATHGAFGALLTAASAFGVKSQPRFGDPRLRAQARSGRLIHRRGTSAGLRRRGGRQRHGGAPRGASTVFGQATQPRSLGAVGTWVTATRPGHVIQRLRRGTPRTSAVRGNGHRPSRRQREAGAGAAQTMDGSGWLAEANGWLQACGALAVEAAVSAKK